MSLSHYCFSLSLSKKSNPTSPIPLCSHSHQSSLPNLGKLRVFLYKSMASSSSSSSSFISKLILICFSLIIYTISSSNSVEAAHVSESSLGSLITGATLEWPTSIMSDLYDEDESSGLNDRRSLFWRTMHYYISYGALSANRVPCPPRSGRSYYTHNCYRSSAPAHPYTRGCSRITRCRR